MCDYVADRSFPMPTQNSDSILDQSSFLALKLAFSLPPGTYATMFLRELTKDSTDVLHQSSLTDSSRSRALVDNLGANAAIEEDTAYVNSTRRLPDIDEDEQNAPVGIKRAKV